MAEILMTRRTQSCVALVPKRNLVVRNRRGFGPTEFGEIDRERMSQCLAYLYSCLQIFTEIVPRIAQWFFWSRENESNIYNTI